MKHVTLVATIHISFATAFSSHSFPANTTLVNASPAIASAPPRPSPGESAGQWIDQLFPDSNCTSVNTSSPLGSTFPYQPGLPMTGPIISETGRKRLKRGYVESNGFHASVWTNDTEKIAYNISVDFSNCSTGLRTWTVIGFYTFTNGTTSHSTTLEDMVTDLWSLRHSRSNPNAPLANHTAWLAEQAMDEANELLHDYLICPNSTAPASNAAVIPFTDEIIHVELRKLQANPQSYWASVILSAGIGAITGASIAAGLDYRFKGNITAQNTIQTGTVVAVTIIIAGILNRMHEVGRLDRAQPMAQAVAHNAVQLVPAGRDAVVQNVFVANARNIVGNLRRIASGQRDIADTQQQVVGAMEDAGIDVPDSVSQSVESNVANAAVMSAAAAHASAAMEDIESCLTSSEAAEAASAVGQMSDAQIGLESMEDINQQVADRDEDGSCGV